MNVSVPLVSVLYLGAAAVAGTAALLVWRRREVAGGRRLALMLVAAAFWALCDVLEVAAGSLETKRLISQVQYLGVVSVTPFFFHAALALAHVRSRLRPGELIAVWLIPAATLLLAWTSRWHAWVWTAIEAPAAGTPFATYRYGPWFWVFLGHGYLLLLLGSGILLRAARRVARPLRAQLRVVACALLLPWLGNVLYVFKLGPIPGLNWLSISLVAFGSLVAWAVVGGGLLDLVPRAREAILERMSDGVLVVDRGDGVVLANDAARAMFDLTRRPSWLPGRLASGPEPTAAGEPILVELDRDGGRRWIEVRVDGLQDRWGEEAGRLFVLRDVSARRRLELERERLIGELRAALAEVRTLQGMLPICANCKRIRDDRGSWSQIENYLRQRAPIEFTHGLCPDCMTDLFGERVDQDPATPA